MKTIRIAQALALASLLLQAPAALGQKVEPGAFNHDFLLTSIRVAGPLDTADLDPTSPAWSGAWAAAPVTKVTLMWKITADVNVEAFTKVGAGRVLNVQSVNDGASIAFRYSFNDLTQSDTIADVPLFHDAAAISVPFGVADSSFFSGCDAGPLQFDMIHMGNPCNDPAAFQCCPVGMLFWRADKGTPNPAGGRPATLPGPSESEVITGNSPGSVHEVAETDADIVHTWQAYNAKAKAWTVVVVRPVESPPPLDPPEGATIICREGIVGTAPLPPAPLCTPVGNLPNLFPGATYQIVFANWDGGQQERNGHKFIGQWGDLLVQ